MSLIPAGCPSKIPTHFVFLSDRLIDYIDLASCSVAFRTQWSSIINGQNWPVYNQLLGRHSHSFKTENITLVGLHLES